MNGIEVGTPLERGRENWPESIHICPRYAGVEARVFLAQLTDREIAHYDAGPVLAALFDREGVVVLCLKYGDMPWLDGVVDIHDVPELERIDLGATSPQERLVITHVLVDAASGIVRGLRSTTLSAKFTRLLVDALQRQQRRGHPTDPFLIRRTLDAFDTPQLVEQAAIAEQLTSN